MKNKQEILEQTFISANDLKILIPNVGIHKCRNYVKEWNKELVDKNVFIPTGRTILVPTKFVIKKLNF